MTNEPRSLKTYRSTPRAAYDSCNKADIRASLLNEQGFIYAYCMRRIKSKTTDIEHYSAQSNDSKLKLNYGNMLAVCNVSEGRPSKAQHCDKSRRNQVLTINPLIKNCEKKIKYGSDGEIYSDNELINHDLNKKLNLNLPRLMKNREKFVEEVRVALNRKYKNTANKTWQKSDLSTEIKRLKSREDDKFVPFCQAAIFYLENKLARL